MSVPSNVRCLVVMQLVVRQYRPSDKDTVQALFSNGVLEHIRPCFRNVMTTPLYITITLSLCVAGYLLASVFGAVALPAAWAGLIYYCCHSFYAGFVKAKLATDMQDISGSYLSKPDDCLWVAEAEVGGRAQILGMVAVLGKRNGEEKHGELLRMVISPMCRRMGLGVRMVQTVIDFCKERGFSKVVLETTSMAGVALYKKVGFSVSFIFTPRNEIPFWMLKLANVKFLGMEKNL